MTIDEQLSTPPALQILPTAKEKKYDRQLRLWGASGQAALEQSHVLLINNGTGVAGVETLKNLVLPGIGQFTILDSGIVTEADLGVNFFLEEESLGKFRAVETTRLLEELNPEVRGHSITEPIQTYCTSHNAFDHFSLILVAAPIDPSILTIIRDRAWDRKLPLFYFHCVGFYSHFSVQLPPAFPIVDTHPDPNTTQDLRLLKPWPELETFSKQTTAQLDIMSHHEKAHIPYICLIMHYVEEWKKEHVGEVPDTYAAKSTVRNIIRQAGGDEENFEEAYNATLKSLNPPAVPSVVHEIYNAPETVHLDADSASFWFIARAIRSFIELHGVLPLPGTLPDMKAQSTEYIKLQTLYKDKARADCAEVTSTVHTLEMQAGRKPSIDPREIESFCKAAGQVHLARGRQLPVVQAGQPIVFQNHGKSLLARLQDPDSLALLYLAWLAWDEFNASHPATTQPMEPRVPGSLNDTAELTADEQKLSSIAHHILDDLIKQNSTTVDNPGYDELLENLSAICIELTRAGGVELHNIASLTGGMLAQEVVKAITAQYSPVDNTCLFDGITSKASVLQI